MEKERNDKNLPGQIEDSSYPDDWWLDEEDSADGLPVFDPDKAQNYAKPGEPMITGYEALERRRGIRRPERKLSRREKRAWKKAQKYELKLHKAHEKEERKLAKQAAKHVLVFCKHHTVCIFLVIIKCIRHAYCPRTFANRRSK